MALCKIGLSQPSRWAGVAHAGEGICRVTFRGSLPFLAVSPGRPAPRGSAARPHTCIAELFVEPILQVQLGGPGFYGFLGGEKENG